MSNKTCISQDKNFSKDKHQKKKAFINIHNKKKTLEVQSSGIFPLKRLKSYSLKAEVNILLLHSCLLKTFRKRKVTMKELFFNFCFQKGVLIFLKTKISKT